MNQLRHQTPGKTQSRKLSVSGQNIQKAIEVLEHPPTGECGGFVCAANKTKLSFNPKNLSKYQ